LFGKKVVVKDSTVNGITNLLRYPFGKSMQRVIIGNSIFVAMTQAIKKNYIISGIKENNIYLIPNGVDVPTIQWTHKNNERFVFVGNLYQQPAKGVDVLLKAWKMVIKQIPDVQLDIIGNGNIEAYNNYVKTLGIANNVRFLGKQTEVQKYLVESRAFILPSRREGMSNALLEAMALGMPCIATNISGSQDLIQPFLNGMLLPAEDEIALTEAIVYIYKNSLKAQLMGKEARVAIEKGYAFNIVAEKYFQLFTSKL
jgi:glycosyltransferase involved in cell wall biosynthesis